MRLHCRVVLICKVDASNAQPHHRKRRMGDFTTHNGYRAVVCADRIKTQRDLMTALMPTPLPEARQSYILVQDFVPVQLHKRSDIAVATMSAFSCNFNWLSGHEYGHC
jgi:hypothetical protein